MKDFVVNVPVRMCCGQPADTCTCNVTPPEPEYATAADLDILVGNVAQTTIDPIPCADDDLLPVPVWNWTDEAARLNR